MTQINRDYSGFDFESPVYRFGPLVTQENNCLCVPIIYGQVKAAGNKIWQDSGTTTFNAIVSFADGQVSSLSNVQINDYDISPLAGCSHSDYVGNGQQAIDSRVTGTTQADKAAIVGGLKYNAYIALTATASDKVSSNYFNVTALITGKLIKVYSTPTTYTTVYSNNPVWCILDFLTCYNGCGLTLDQINIQSFIDAASYCDTKINPINATGTVNTSVNSAILSGSGTKFTTEAKIGDQITINGQTKLITQIISDTALVVDSNFSNTMGSQTMIVADTRFTLNLILDQRKTRLEWLNEMLIACRAYLVYNNSTLTNNNSLLSIKIEQDDTVVQSFGPNDIITGTETFWISPKEKSCDIFKVQYIDPNRNYARIYAHAESDTFQNDPPLIQEIQTLGVTNFKQASRLAWFYLNQANTCNKFISFKTTKKGFNRSPGDLIQITSTFMGYENKKMRIVRMIETQDGQIQIICREYNGPVNAFLTTSLAKPNSNLVYNSAVQSSSANNITIKYTDPYQYNQALSVSVLGNNININLATDASGHIISTAAQIMSAINGNSSVASLVSATFAPNNDGTGIVTSMLATNLSGGNEGIYADQLGSDEPVVNVVSLNNVLKAPDNIQSFSTSQNATSIILTWQAVSGANITYEIREGNSWNESRIIATSLTDLTYTVLNIQKGTYKYWIAAVNKYGNYSDTPKLSTIVISDIPETNTIFNENILDNDIALGTRTNCYTVQGKIVLNPTNNWDNSDTWKNTGAVYAPDGYWGADCTNTGCYITKIYDLTSNLSSIISTNYNLYSRDNSSNILIEWRYSQDNATWTDWQTFSQGGYTFRYYQFKITLNSPNSKFTALTNFTVNIDITNRDLYFSSQVISNANTGVTVNFNPTFIFTPAVVANISDGTSGYCVISAKSNSQATIMAYNNSGTPINAIVDIRIKGY